MIKRRNLEPKKWSLFDIVEIYSSGVKMTLNQWRQTEVKIPLYMSQRILGHPYRLIFKFTTYVQCDILAMAMAYIIGCRGVTQLGGLVPVF